MLPSVFDQHTGLLDFGQLRASTDPRSRCYFAARHCTYGHGICRHGYSLAPPLFSAEQLHLETLHVCNHALTFTLTLTGISLTFTLTGTSLTFTLTLTGASLTLTLAQKPPDRTIQRPCLSAVPAVGRDGCSHILLHLSLPRSLQVSLAFSLLSIYLYLFLSVFLRPRSISCFDAHLQAHTPTTCIYTSTHPVQKFPRNTTSARN